MKMMISDYEFAAIYVLVTYIMLPGTASEDIFFYEPDSFSFAVRDSASLHAGQHRKFRRIPAAHPYVMHAQVFLPERTVTGAGRNTAERIL